jgi:hypothetical protein
VLLLSKDKSGVEMKVKASFSNAPRDADMKERLANVFVFVFKFKLETSLLLSYKYISRLVEYRQ